jgi:CheY-like chemotaxis protein
MLHASRHTVLLIEEDASLRRLMALGLQYRGMRIIEAPSPDHLPAIEGQQPDLLVLDVEGGVSSNWSLLATVQSHPYLSTLPMVVLAWEELSSEYMYHSAVQSPVTCLTKPFDARALHASIEQLLVESAPREAANAQEMPSTVELASPTPSIWPLITAAGLLLAFIGLLGSIAITAVGLLIFMTALLLWTLGTKPEQASIPNTPLGV